MRTRLPILIAAVALAAALAGTALGTGDGGAPGVDVGDVTVNNAAGAAAVNVQDGGNTLTIDGSAGGAVTQGAGAADANTLRFTQSTDDAGVTSLAALDDLVRNEDAIHANGEAGVQALGVRSDAALTLAGADGDYAPPVLTSLGAYRTTAQTERFVDSAGAVFLVASAFTSVATGGALEVEVVAAQGAGNSILVLRWIVASSAAASVNFESDDSDAGLGPPIPLAANGGWTADFQAGWYETADNQGLMLQVSASTTISVQVWYVVR